MERCNGDAVMFKHPFTAIVCGASKAGKTTFILNMIKYRENMITPPPDRVIYSYLEYQPAFDSPITERVQFVKKSNYTLDKTHRNLLIIDDQSSALDSGDINIGRLFSVDSHHRNTSVIFVTHNLFHNSKDYRLAALNSDYIILFKSPRAPLQLATLARQLLGDKAKSRNLVKAYFKAVKKPYSYLLIDTTVDSHPSLRYRTDILPDQGVEFYNTRLTKCYMV